MNITINLVNDGKSSGIRQIRFEIINGLKLIRVFVIIIWIGRRK